VSGEAVDQPYFRAGNMTGKLESLKSEMPAGTSEILKGFQPHRVH
jgi:hypothetical protein